MNIVVKHYYLGSKDFNIVSFSKNALVADMSFVKRDYANLVYLAIILGGWFIAWILFSLPTWYPPLGSVLPLVVGSSFVAHWLCTRRYLEVRSIEGLAAQLKIPGEQHRGLLIGEFARRGWEAVLKAEDRVYLAFITRKDGVETAVLLCFEGLGLTATNTRLWLTSNAIVAEEGPRLTLEDGFWSPNLDGPSKTTLLAALNTDAGRSQLAIG